jgi:hypothetical protein
MEYFEIVYDLYISRFMHFLGRLLITFEAKSTLDSAELKIILEPSTALPVL